jgi:hypothetical protein
MNTTFESIAVEGGFRVRVHRDGQEFVYETDSFPSAESALAAGQRWAQWAEDLPSGNADTIYYILVVPETWPGPPPGGHPFSGLHMKIGRTNNVLTRLQNLKTGTSGELIIHALEPGEAAVEQRRHQQFANDRRQGEWFACSPELCQHAMDTWERNNLLPPEHQRRMMRLLDRIRIYRGVREVFGKAPDMVNPSLTEKWTGSVLVDTLFTSLVKKDGFWDI